MERDENMRKKKGEKSGEGEGTKAGWYRFQRGKDGRRHFGKGIKEKKKKKDDKKVGERLRRT